MFSWLRRRRNHVGFAIDRAIHRKNFRQNPIEEQILQSGLQSQRWSELSLQGRIWALRREKRAKQYVFGDRGHPETSVVHHRYRGRVQFEMHLPDRRHDGRQSFQRQHVGDPRVFRRAGADGPMRFANCHSTDRRTAGHCDHRPIGANSTFRATWRWADFDLNLKLVWQFVRHPRLGSRGVQGIRLRQFS